MSNSFTLPFGNHHQKRKRRNRHVHRTDIVVDLWSTNVTVWFSSILYRLLCITKPKRFVDSSFVLFFLGCWLFSSRLFSLYHVKRPNISLLLHLVIHRSTHPLHRRLPENMYMYFYHLLTYLLATVCTSGSTHYALCSAKIKKQPSTWCPTQNLPFQENL